MARRLERRNAWQISGRPWKSDGAGAPPAWDGTRVGHVMARTARCAPIGGANESSNWQLRMERSLFAGFPAGASSDAENRPFEAGQDGPCWAGLPRHGANWREDAAEDSRGNLNDEVRMCDRQSM